MFPSRKKMGPLIAESCDRPGLRIFLLACLFAMIMSAFWWHFERRLGQLTPPDGSLPIMDAQEHLQAHERDSLYAWRQRLKDSWNVPLLVHVSEGPLELPPFAANTLYLGVGMARQEAVVVTPPLVRKILGEGERLQTEEALAQCLKDAPPAPCLEKAIENIWKKLQ